MTLAGLKAMPPDEHSTAVDAGSSVKMTDVTPRLPESVARERAEAAGWTPDDDVPFPGVGQKWPGVCKRCGKRIAPRLNAAERNGPCATCGRERQAKSQRLPNDVARQRALEVGWKPYDT